VARASPSFSQSIALGPSQRADQRRHRKRSSTSTPASSTTRSAPRTTAGSSTSGCEPCTTVTCCGTPTARLVIETPQYCCCGSPAGLSKTPSEAIGFYKLMASLAYLPSSPTLFNSGTMHTQMSSCYLIDSPRDELDSIYARYAQVAQLSKFAGGIGISWSRVRSRGALIRGTNGHSNGIVPWLRHPGLISCGSQPGRTPQGCGLRISGDLATPRHRGIPGAARQHRRRRPPRAQLEPGELDSR